MRLDVLCIRSNLFLPEVFRYQPENLGDIGQHFYTIYQDVSNFPEVIPMILNVSYADADGSYLTIKL